MFRIAFLGFVLLVFCSVGFGQETSDYFVRADSWQESLRQSREKLVAETGKASTNRQRRRLWGQVQKAFADTQSQLEMTMDKTERIWDEDWGSLSELAGRYVEAAREVGRYQKIKPALEQPTAQVETAEQLKAVREFYYRAFRMMEAEVLRDADENIRRHRMGTLIINAEPDAEVTVEQLRHDFLFGTSLNDQMWATKADFDDPRVWKEDFNWLNDKWRWEMIESNRERYYQLIKDNFNIGVFQNAAKWFNIEPLEGEIYWTSAERTTKWAMANGIAMRGHCVIWDCERFVPKWQSGLDDAHLRRVVKRRCKEVASWFAGRIDDWDLNNEMLHCSWYGDRLGEEIVGDMFRWFMEANPNGKLALNDFNILNNRYRSRLDDYVAQARGYLDRGYALSGINCQAHSWGGVTNIGFAKYALEELAAVGLPLKISEYIIDKQAGNDEYAAVMLDKHFRVCFGQPAVESIIFWGIWEGTHFEPSNALWNKDFSPRPVASAYRKLAFDEWWTNWSGKADENGVCRVPVFYGRHKVSVGGEGMTVEYPKSDGSEKMVGLR